MARRASAAWGANARAAQKGSDDTMFYSNCCLQHANLNQDEWLELEDWVKGLDLDSDGRITSFSGPVYGELSRTIRPSGRVAATIPAGFFKVICFKNKNTGKLDVRAFLMYQDEEALRDKRGRHRTNNQTYQVTITEIESLTGLRFDDDIYDKNSLFFFDSDAARDVNAETPERIEINTGGDITDRETPRVPVSVDSQNVYICAAMINPHCDEREGEWISILNCSHQALDVSDWVLSDKNGRSRKIQEALSQQNANLLPGESIRVENLSPVMLSNKGGTIQLMDGNGSRVDKVKYFDKQLRDAGEGVPVVFIGKRHWGLADERVTPIREDED